MAMTKTDLAELKELLEQNGIKATFDYKSVSLLFKNGDVIAFKAEGYEGTHLEVHAVIAKTFSGRLP